MQMCICCVQPASQRCSGCTVPSAWYCSEKCQREHWVLHIFECNPRKPINTAYRLARAVYQDRLPEDSQTCEDYGFNRVLTTVNKTNLFNLYIGLIKIHRVEPKTIHKWRIQGKLIQEIKSIFEGLPKDHQGYYYQWFLQNPWVLDRTHAAPDSLNQILSPGFQYAGGSASATVEEINAVKASWPENKSRCLGICCCLFANMRPGPEQHLWLVFGFCVCQEDNEPLLAGLYQQLLQKCSFAELYAAFDSSSLGALFYSKGLKAEFDNFRYLGDILNRSSSWNSSVWDLKQFVFVKDGTLIPTVGADYGFFNCYGEVEIALLKKVYRQFFQHPQGDPMKLHEAASEGKTFAYIESLVKLENNDRMTIQRVVKKQSLEGPTTSIEPLSTQSVLDLKRFVVENGNLIPSISVDYGFLNCRDEVERSQLKDVYRQFFQHPEANLIKLHQAAIGGKTLEYVKGLVNLENDREMLARLMKNPYPLPEIDF